MPKLEGQLSPEHSMALAVDVSTLAAAEEKAQLAKNAGAWIIKEGLELISATSTRDCSELAADFGLEWVADAKLYDIPNTVARTVENYAQLPHPPLGITIATRSGVDSLRAAQDIATENGITILGVTHLTTVDDEETKLFERLFSKTVVKRELRRADAAKIGGAVCSGKEVALAQPYNLFTMIPGTRSKDAAANDQKRTVTQEEAIFAGANLLVIGREVTAAEYPEQVYAGLIERIASAQQQLRERRAA